MTQHVELKPGIFTIVDDEDVPVVVAHRWHVVIDKQTCYARTKLSGRTVSLHRWIIGAKRGELVDHRNGNGLDNRRENLRICTPTENCHNRRKKRGDAVSQFKGVYAYKGRWRTKITVNGLNIHVGIFDVEDDAAAAYDAAATRFFGEFARTNTT